MLKLVGLLGFYMQKNKKSDVVRRECVWVEESECENPVITCPIEERINTELFIDRTATLYIEETLHKGSEQWGWSDNCTCWLEDWVNLVQKYYLDTKGCGNERPGVNLSWNEFNGNVKECANCW